MALAKGALEDIVVTLVGEVSELSNKPGYKAVYFSVKDEAATMPCMMWMNRYHSFGVDLRVGTLVQITGRFTLYAPKGRMNFDVFSLALAGEGNLRQQVAMRAKRLQDEGLMDASRKRPIPAMPSTIGVVTSPRGAAVHDVLRTLRRRWPQAQVVLAGVPVEGTQAPAHLIEGINCVAKGGAQVILLVRGGGSFEDLMPFNDEGLARAIAACAVPIVTGIGHEPDTCIADMVADLRSSTPTAAAEAVSPDQSETNSFLAASGKRIHKASVQMLKHYRLIYEQRASRPVLGDPQQLFATDAQTLDYTEERLHRIIPVNLAHDAKALDAISCRLAQSGKMLLDNPSARVSLSAARLEDLSPLGILARGYSMARTKDGALIKNHTQAPVGSHIEVTLAHGVLEAEVTENRGGDFAALDWKE